jgi:hypothetical protein
MVCFRETRMKPAGHKAPDEKTPVRSIWSPGYLSPNHGEQMFTPLFSEEPHAGVWVPGTFQDPVVHLIHYRMPSGVHTYHVSMHHGCERIIDVYK